MKVKDNDIMILVEFFANNPPQITRYQKFGYIHNNPINKNSKLFIEFNTNHSSDYYVDYYPITFLNKALNGTGIDYKAKVLLKWIK